MTLRDINLLFRRYRQDLVRFLSRRGTDPETAADLAQDAFVRLLRIEGDGREIGRAYLFRTAANLAIDHDRRRRILPFAPLTDEGLAAIADPAPSPERIVIARQDLARATAAILELPPRCRDVFLLARIEGLSYAEIGARLGISPKTAFGHMTRALVLLARAAPGRD